jgi:hypothetical protein
MTAGLSLFQTGIPGGSLPVARPAIYGTQSIAEPRLSNKAAPGQQQLKLVTLVAVMVASGWRA